MKLLSLIAAIFSTTAVADEPVMKAGRGSYRTSIPRPCEPLPTKIYRTSDVRGPVPTNQWWSSLIWQKHSENMFAHPAFVRCDPDGVVMGYPGSSVHGNETGIFGSADLRQGDLKIVHSAVDHFPRADCGGYSDWFVTAVMANGDQTLTTSFGHGSPFVYRLIEEGDPRVTFTKAPQVWGNTRDGAVLGVSVNGSHYGLFGETGSTWEASEGVTFTNTGRNGKHFSIAVLPNDELETLQLFAKYAHAHVTSTRVDYKVEAGQVLVTYRFECSPREGIETETLFALYPHQWKYATTNLSDLSYGSIRGVMKIGTGKQFETSVPIQCVLPMLPHEGIVDHDRLIAQLQAEADKPKPGFGDTYAEGKHLGVLASLSGIADAAGSTELQAVFVDEIKRRLEDWFTAAVDKEQPVFFYDSNWGALIGSRPSFGSDRLLNDHHFHYGYFIRAAAEVARSDPAWSKEWGPMVNLLIRDIATPLRDDAMFPHMRCFDKYAGHSWASGNANFADGNNQESSSEAMNAWYGLILWGAVTGDQQVRDLGLFLFNTERTAIEEYWFDVSGSNYPSDFPNVALGMVWGGKGAFGTWFSGDIDCIHGINWLPFTPASVYLGRHPSYVKQNFARVLARREGGNDFDTGWGDLVLMYGALNDPKPSVKHLASHPNAKIEAGNSRPFMEHWTATLAKLGHIDAHTTSSYPFTNVFVQGGNKTYAAYNFGPEPIEVSFSDGFRLPVRPGSMAVQHDD